MKKLKLIIFVVIIALLSLCACNYPYSSKNRPSDFPNTKWVSDNPNIYFTVDEDGQCIGVVNTGTEVFDIYVGFVTGPHIGIYYIDKNNLSDLTTDKYISSSCKYYKDKLVVTDINPKYDTIFNGKYKEITFYRQDLDEETSETESKDK